MYETSTYGQSEDALAQEMQDQFCGCIEVMRDLQAVENEPVGKHRDLLNSNSPGKHRDLLNSNSRLLRNHVGEIPVGFASLLVRENLLK